MRGFRLAQACFAWLLAATVVVPVTAGPVSAQNPPPTVDYDSDDDGLIEISSLAHLNAIRWDLDGDGDADVYPPDKNGRTGHDPDGATKYAAAFPNAAAGMGCPSTGCDGYELTANLNFDTNGNGQADAGDDYWNGGKGWIPLMGGEAVTNSDSWSRFLDLVDGDFYGDRPNPRARMFTAVFEGNGRVITNLYINDTTRWYAGLFGFIGPGAHVRNFGLTRTNSDSGVRGALYVGSLAGAAEGARVSGVYSSLDVAGTSYVGGLMGMSFGLSLVIESFVTGDVSGRDGVGGLVGYLGPAGIAASYATGDVTATYASAGGLVGYWPGGRIRATYATGSVTLDRSAVVPTNPVLVWGYVESTVGGLIGGAAYCGGISPWPRMLANYAIGAVSGPQAERVGGLTGGCNGSPESFGGDLSYWDTDTSGAATTVDIGVGYTTAQLQAPTGYTGIYADWNVDVDVESYYGPFNDPNEADDPWDFGTSTQYPVLKYCADKPGIQTPDGQPYCPLDTAQQRVASLVDPNEDQTTTDNNDDDDDPAAEHPVVKYAALVKSFYDRITANSRHGDGPGGGWNKRFLKALRHSEYVNYPQPAVTVADAQRLFDHGGPGANTAWTGTVEAVTYAVQYFSGLEPPPTPVVSITAGAGVTEGSAASFTLSASPAPASAVTVKVNVTAVGSFGVTTGVRDIVVPTTGTKTFTVDTTGDTVDETDGSATATVQTGTGYTVGTPSTGTVRIADDDVPAAEHPLVKYAGLVTSFYDRITANSQHGDGAGGGWNKRFLKALGHSEYVNYPQPAVTVADAQRLFDHGGPGANTAWTGTVEAVTYAEQYFSGVQPPPTPVVSITAGSGVTEGSAASFTLSASPAPTSAITVKVNITATGSYGVTTGVRDVMVPTSGTKTFTVDTTGDSVDEPNGTATATVQIGTGYTVGTPSAGTVNISDDDNPPPPPPPPPVAVPVVSITAGSGVTEGTAASFTLSASPAPTSAITVKINVTATGSFGVTTGVRNIVVPDTGTKTFTVGTTGDSVDESDGSATATVQTGTGYTVGAPSAGTVAISDDDDPPVVVPVVSITAGPGVTEGSAASFTLSASPAPTSAITVKVNVTATGSFGVTTGVRNIVVPDTGTKTFTVGTTGDDQDETDGTTTATVQTGTGYTVGAPSAGTVNISDDDVPEVTITAGSGVTEGTPASFTVSAIPTPHSPLAVTVAITATGDYGITTGNRTVTIPTTGTLTFTVPTTGDNQHETNGSATATVQTGTGYTVGTPSAGTVTISDDDPAPVGNSGTLMVSAQVKKVRSSQGFLDPMVGRPGQTLIFEISTSDVAQQLVTIGFAVESLQLSAYFDYCLLPAKTDPEGFRCNTLPRNYNDPTGTVTIAQGGDSATVTVFIDPAAFINGWPLVDLKLTSVTGAKGFTNTITTGRVRK